VEDEKAVPAGVFFVLEKSPLIAVWMKAEKGEKL